MKAVGRGLDILWALVHARQPQTAAEVAAVIGVNKASAYRLLEALAEEGWILGDGQPKRYRASLRVAEMGATLLVNDRVRQVVLPYMVELAQAVQNTVLLNFYESGNVVITDVAEQLGERFLPSLVTFRIPAAATAAGKALLAYQSPEEIARVCQQGLPSYTSHTKTSPEAIAAAVECSRVQGYGTADCELQPELSSVGVPVFDYHNHVVAAFGMTVPGRLTEETVERLLGPGHQFAQRASVALGFRPANLTLVS